MKGLAERGDWERALTQYDFCQKRIGEELGVRPEKTTTNLAADIKQKYASSESIVPQTKTKLFKKPWPRRDARIW